MCLGPQGIIHQGFDNDSWFDIQFISKIQLQDQHKIILTTTYYNAMKQACIVLDIMTKHYARIGHVAGIFSLETNDLQILGNWDVKLQEKHYLNYLPMQCSSFFHLRV